jgi:hypothetical protein
MDDTKPIGFVLKKLIQEPFEDEMEMFFGNLGDKFYSGLNKLVDKEIEWEKQLKKK